MTAFAQNTRDEVRVQGDGTISGALAAQPGMKQQTYVAECLTPWDGQAVRVYSQDGTFPTLQARPGQAGQNSQSVLVDASEPIAVDYKQTPKTSDGICHTLTHECDGGIHSAVAYGDCLTPWDVQSKRVFAEDGCGPTLPSGGTEGMTIQPVVMASGQSHAEIGEGGGRANTDRASRFACTSNGDDVFPALCATDGDKRFIDNQSIRSGRLLLDPRQEWV